MANSILSLLFLFFLLYLGMAAFIFFNQSRYVYYPELDIIANPGHIGLDFDDVSFTASDGVSLSGWFIPAGKSRATILFCHGNGGNISHRLESIEIFNRLGYSVFIFDYRGYGRSEGVPGEEGTYLDAEAAWNFLVDTKQTAPGNIILFGRSLGGVIAARLGGAHQAKACILESTFTSIPDMAAALYGFLPIKLLCRFSYDALAAVPRITCPLLVIHSPDDEIVPISHGRKLFQAAAEPKMFLEMRGGHNTGFLQSGSLYEEGLEQFFDSL